MMDIPLDEVLHFDAITSNSSGAAVDADSTPSWELMEEDTDTAIQSGTFTKRTSKTGNYRGTVTLSAANGFEVGKWYSIIATGIVDGVTGKACVKSFRVVIAEDTTGVPRVDAARWAGFPTASNDSALLTLAQLQEGLGTAALQLLTAEQTTSLVSSMSTVSQSISEALTAIAAVQADLPTKITKNTAFNNFPFYMVLSSDHITGATGLTVTAERSLDGAAFAACANAVSEVSNGLYKINLAAGDLNGDSVVLKFTAATADARVIAIVTQRT